MGTWTVLPVRTRRRAVCLWRTEESIVRPLGSVCITVLIVGLASVKELNLLLTIGNGPRRPEYGVPRITRGAYMPTP